MAETTYNCYPRMVFFNTFTVVGAGTALEVLEREKSEAEGPFANEPRLVAASNGLKTVPQVKAPAGLVAALEAGGKVIGAAVHCCAASGGTAGTNLKFGVVEPFSKLIEQETKKEEMKWFPAAFSQAEAEEKLNTIAKIEEARLLGEKFTTAKALWISGLYLSVVVSEEAAVASPLSMIV